MKLKALFFFLFFLEALGLNAQVPGFFIVGNEKKVVLPFLASNSLILLPVSINGHPPVYFLLDTGVKANLLFSKAMGDTLGLTYTRRVGMVGADGTSTVWAQVSPINSLGLGKVEGALQSLLVLEEDFLELESVIGIPVYGILGYEFFKHNAVKIDYEQSILTVYPPERGVWRSPFYRRGTLQVVDGKAYLDVKVKQQTGPRLAGKVLVDTGANHGLMLNRETTSAIRLPEKQLETQLGQSLGGVLYGVIGRVDVLSIRGLTFSQVLSSFPEETPFSSRIKESGRIGSLGAEVLGRTTLILDYPRNEFFLKRNASFFHPFEFDMSGLVVKKMISSEKRFFVGDVREGSPAHLAGILPFDELISINAVPVLLWDMDQLVTLFRSEEGREIEVELRRYPKPGASTFQQLAIRFRLTKQI
jgi:predicted aspartyl protease